MIFSSTHCSLAWLLTTVAETSSSRPMSLWQACCHDSDATASLSR